MLVEVGQSRFSRKSCAPDVRATLVAQNTYAHPCASTRSVIIQSELEFPLNYKYVPTAYAFSNLEAGDISDWVIKPKTRNNAE